MSEMSALSSTNWPLHLQYRAAGGALPLSPAVKAACVLVLAGQERAVPLPEEAAKSAKATHDLLRRFKELGTNMKAHPPPSALEQDLQVGFAEGHVVA